MTVPLNIRARSGLQDLDIHLVDVILSFLESIDLIRCCLTCKDLLPSARRLLFKQIELSHHQGSQNQAFVVDLNRLLDSQPEYNSACRRFKLLGLKPDPIHGSGEDPIFPRKTTRLQRSKRILIQPLEARSDAEYIALIYRFKNLRTLELGTQFSGLALMLDKSLHSLRNIRFIEEGEEHLGESWIMSRLVSIDPNLMRSIFQLPAIEDVKIIVPPSQLVPLCLDEMQSSPTLSSLEFEWTRLDPEELTKILAKTPNLKRFSFHYYEDREKEYGVKLVEYLSMSDLSDALLQVANSLQELIITMVWQDGDNPQGGFGGPDYINYGPRGHLDLKQMRRLKVTDVPLAILLGLFPDVSPDLYEVLPPDLEQLCISDDLAYWIPYRWRPTVLDEYMQRWIPNLPSHLPLLKVLKLRAGEEIHFPQSDTYWTHDNPELFLELCRSVGIKGVIETTFEEHSEE
ncbi:MAG: hypothetical protein M1820_001637 [Bogoriella megaspora]|nr:MAG: hypothetical protein M1820_001637 [Bogoriella megaspora]